MVEEDCGNFKNSLRQLKLFCKMPIENNRDKAGIIQAFEFTYEQSWKFIQKKAGQLGTKVGAPRQAFSAALTLGWILEKDEPQWLNMMTDRNLTSHTYKEDIADEVIDHIQKNYLALFESLLENLTKNN